MDTIHEFMQKFFKSSCAAEKAAQKATRDFFCVELRGFAEFIGVNGKLYRYGFVSDDDERTCRLLRALFHDDFQHFRDTVGVLEEVDSWADVHAPELKLHLKNHPDAVVALKKLLPSPLPLINPASLNWLRGIYTTIDRLNSDWDTNFEHWSELRGLELEDDQAARDRTSADISHLNHMLTTTTANALQPQACAMEKPLDTAFRNLPPLPTDSKHGQAELTFATLASLLPDLPHETLYAMLLLYLASSFARNAFAPLPPSAATYADARGRETFLEHYYDTTTRTLQTDWNQLLNPLAHTHTIKQFSPHQKEGAARHEIFPHLSIF
jgi:hypothetical protein